MRYLSLLEGKVLEVKCGVSDSKSHRENLSGPIKAKLFNSKLYTVEMQRSDIRIGVGADPNVFDGSLQYL